mgnify:CR=1
PEIVFNFIKFPQPNAGSIGDTVAYSAGPVVNGHSETVNLTAASAGEITLEASADGSTITYTNAASGTTFVTTLNTPMTGFVDIDFVNTSGILDIDLVSNPVNLLTTNP